MLRYSQPWLQTQRQEKNIRMSKADLIVVAASRTVTAADRRRSRAGQFAGG